MNPTRVRTFIRVIELQDQLIERQVVTDVGGDLRVRKTWNLKIRGLPLCVLRGRFAAHRLAQFHTAKAAGDEQGAGKMLANHG